MPGERQSPIPVIVAGILMVGSLVWMLAQMAPHGPRDGVLLARLGIGDAVVVVGTALVILLLGLVRRGRR